MALIQNMQMHDDGLVPVGIIIELLSGLMSTCGKWKGFLV